MNNTELIKQWKAEEKFAFQGWDFSHIDSRWDCPEPPWDYLAIIKTYLKDTDILLDMGTGGGEILLTIGHPHKNTYVTEAYEPNYELCMKVLSPLGITVARTYTDEDFNTDDKLPFEDNLFDVIISRHESFDLKEVDRALKPGGYFITQQVGNKDGVEYMQRLNDGFVSHSPTHTLTRYTDELSSMRYQIIDTDEALYPVKFFDVGALVYFAKIIVWEFPGFSVTSHLDKLLDCQREIDEKGFLQGTGHRFYLVSRKVNA